MLEHGMMGTSRSIVNDYDPFSDGSGIALYKMEGNATDSSGTYSGTTTDVSYITGVFGQAIKFSGSTTSRVETALVASSIVAMSFWVNVSQTGTNAYVIGSVSAVQTKTSAKVATDSFQIWVNNKSTQKTVAISVGWHHVVATYNGSVTEVYIDNVLVTGATNTTLTSTADSIAFGRYRSDYTSTSQSMDQIRFFNRYLTSIEVTQLYNEEI